MVLSRMVNAMAPARKWGRPRREIQSNLIRNLFSIL